MPDKYIKHNCWPNKVLGNKSDVFLEVCSITYVTSVRICIGTTMGYPTQFAILGTL